MTTSFPGSLDAFGNPIASDALNNGVTPHASQHADANDAIEALEAKVGTGASTATAGKALIGGTTAGSSIWEGIARRNLLANGPMRISQRRALSSGVTAVDWTYQSVDRWKTIQNGAVSPWTTTPTNGATPVLGGFPASDRSLLFTSAGNSPKVGIIQIIEAAESAPCRTAILSLQAYLLASASITDLRMAILAWAGTADVVTHPVSSWNGAGVNPTLAANWSYLNTPVNIGATTGFLLKKIEASSVVPGTTNNLAVMIWCDDTAQTLNDIWAVSDVQLEIGSVCTPIERESMARQLLRCQRYYTKTFDQGITPAANLSNANGALSYRAATTGIVNVGVLWAYPTAMRTVPTMAYFNYGAAGSAWWNASIAATSGISGSIAAGDRGVVVNNTQLAGDTIGHLLYIHATADAEL